MSFYIIYSRQNGARVSYFLIKSFRVVKKVVKSSFKKVGYSRYVTSRVNKHLKKKRKKVILLSSYSADVMSGINDLRSVTVKNDIVL